MPKNEIFAKNLKHLCAERVSVAQICREIEIRPQQFSRYLNGAGMPSAHNLRKICLHFDLQEQHLFMDHVDFKTHREAQNQRVPHHFQTPLARAFPGDISRLRKYVGSYHIHFLTPSWPGSVMVGYTELYELDGQVLARTIERGKDPALDQVYRTRYNGAASHLGHRIFVVEFESEQEGSITQTTLYPAHRQQRTYLRGMTLGLAWRPRRFPYASRSIWKRIETSQSPRSSLSKCGIYPMDHRFITPTVRNFLLEKTRMTGEDNTS